MERKEFEEFTIDLIKNKLSKYKIKTNVDSNMNIIKIDFDNDDFETIVTNYEKIKEKYFIVNKKMNVIYSKAFEFRKRFLTKYQMQIIREIEDKLTSNVSVKPYLSTNLYLSKFSKSDELLEKYNIYHMHLSEPDKNEHFVSRTDKLLFFTYDNDNVYFLDVRKHPQGDEWNNVKAIDVKDELGIISDPKVIFCYGEISLLSKLNKIYEENKDEIKNILKEII